MTKLILALKSPLGTTRNIINLIRAPKLKLLTKVKPKSNFISIFNFGP